MTADVHREPAPRPAMGLFERYLSVWVVLCIVAGIALGSVALAVLLSLIPWSRKSNLYAEGLDSEIHGDLIPHNAVPEGTVPTGALPVVPAAATRKEL